MKVLVFSFLLSLGVLVSARSLETFEDYPTKEENFALGVNEFGHALDEPYEDKEGSTRDLTPGAACLWNLIVCWNERKISSSKCGRIYSDCHEDIKKGKTPSPPEPATRAPPPEPVTIAPPPVPTE